MTSREYMHPDMNRRLCRAKIDETSLFVASALSSDWVSLAHHPEWAAFRFYGTTLSWRNPARQTGWVPACIRRVPLTFTVTIVKRRHRETLCSPPPHFKRPTRGQWWGWSCQVPLVSVVVASARTGFLYLDNLLNTFIHSSFSLVI